jgi:hypothetical protein
MAGYLGVRKAKKAGPITERIASNLEKNAAKAGITVEQAVTACCDYAWHTFNPDWYTERQAGPAGMTTANSETAYQRSMRLRVAEVSPSLARPAPGQPAQDATAYFQTIPAIEVTK